VKNKHVRPSISRLTSFSVVVFFSTETSVKMQRLTWGIPLEYLYESREIDAGRLCHRCGLFLGEIKTKLMIFKKKTANLFEEK
jgi:hypothetical protein